MRIKEDEVLLQEDKMQIAMNLEKTKSIAAR
jgi:hypothetical protein